MAEYYIVNEQGERVDTHREEFTRPGWQRRAEGLINLPWRKALVSAPTLTLDEAKRVVRRARTRLGRRYEIREVQP